MIPQLRVACVPDKKNLFSMEPFLVVFVYGCTKAKKKLTITALSCSNALIHPRSKPQDTK